MTVVPFSITDEELLKDEPLKLLSPTNPTPEETIFLSNIDLAVAFTVETVYFFEDGPAKEISNIVKRALAILLVPYYFLAGRLQMNRESGRLELACNNAGVLFVNAKSKVRLKDLGDLSLPDPSFCHFVHRPGLHRNLHERALFTVQVCDEKLLKANFEVFALLIWLISEYLVMKIRGFCTDASCLMLTHSYEF